MTPEETEAARYLLVGAEQEFSETIESIGNVFAKLMDTFRILSQSLRDENTHLKEQLKAYDNVS